MTGETDETVETTEGYSSDRRNNSDRRDNSDRTHTAASVGKEIANLFVSLYNAFYTWPAMGVHSKHEVSPYVAVGLYSHTLADSTFSAHYYLLFFSLSENCVCGPDIASVLQTARVVAVSAYTCSDCPGESCKCGPSCKCSAGTCSCLL